jgi:P27 family predicted phage terminase small subunit
MGRPRKPTALKVVGGTDRADRRNENEPEPALLQDLTPPAHLSPRSAAVWGQLAPMLRKMQVLTEADVISLEMLCDAVGDYRHSRAQLGDDFVATSSKGSEVLSQWLVAQQMNSKRAEAFMGKFGMDPAARTRLMVNPQGDLFDGNAGAAGPARFFS